MVEKTISRLSFTMQKSHQQLWEECRTILRDNLPAEQFRAWFEPIASLGFEDGKLTQPVKDINIIGNGPKALADITMVADNDRIDNGTWTCGKDGQSCPVTCGMPSALVSKLTVGGEN